MSVGSIDNIIALEGPSLAGKTTLAKDIAEINAFTVMPEYTDVLSESPHPEQKTVEGQLSAFRLFMSVEASRYNAAINCQRQIVLDRSVDTLLAHSFALEVVSGICCYAPVRAELAGRRYLVPNLTLFLDVSLPELLSRHNSASPRPHFLLTPEFLSAFRKYFAEEPLITRECRFVSSEVARALLVERTSKNQ